MANSYVNTGPVVNLYNGGNPLWFETPPTTLDVIKQILGNLGPFSMGVGPTPKYWPRLSWPGSKSPTTRRRAGYSGTYPRRRLARRPYRTAYRR